MRNHKNSPASPSGLAQRRRSLSQRPVVEGLEGRTLLSAGGLDPTFNSTGYKTITLPSEGNAIGVINAMTLQDINGQEKIVLVGYEQSDPNVQQSDFVVIRLDANGQLDTSFADGTGIRIVDFPDASGVSGEDQANAVTIDSNNNILVAGSMTTSGGDTDFAVARLTPNGALDTSFGDDDGLGDGLQTGKTSFTVGQGDGFGNFNATAYGIGIDGFGNILVGGSCQYKANGDMSFCVARLTTAGQLDTTFGSGWGWRAYNIVAGTDDNAYAVAITDGQVLIAGSAQASPGSTSDIGIIDLDSSGNYNTEFGGGTGAVTIPDVLGANSSIYASAIAVQPRHPRDRPGRDTRSEGQRQRQHVLRAPAQQRRLGRHEFQWSRPDGGQFRQRRGRQSHGRDGRGGAAQRPDRGRRLGPGEWPLRLRRGPAQRQRLARFLLRHRGPVDPDPRPQQRQLRPGRPGSARRSDPRGRLRRPPELAGQAHRGPGQREQQQLRGWRRRQQRRRQQRRRQQRRRQQRRRWLQPGIRITRHIGAGPRPLRCSSASSGSSRAAGSTRSCSDSASCSTVPSTRAGRIRPATIS